MRCYYLLAHCCRIVCSVIVKRAIGRRVVNIALLRGHSGLTFIIRLCCIHGGGVGAFSASVSGFTDCPNLLLLLLGAAAAAATTSRALISLLMMGLSIVGGSTGGAYSLPTPRILTIPSQRVKYYFRGACKIVRGCQLPTYLPTYPPHV